MPAAQRAAALPPPPHPRPRRTPAPDLAPLVAALEGFTGSTWLATELHLVRSRLGAGPGGTAQHETLATWELTGRRHSVAESKNRHS